MNISFHGIKNAGAQRWFEDDYPQTYKNGKIVKLEKGQHANIHFELTNSKSPDLDEWKPILKDYQFFHNPHAFDLSYDECINPTTLQKEKFLVLNDKQILIKDENLKLLSKIHALLKKVAEMPEEEIKTEYSYLRNGTEADDAFRFYKKEFKDEEGKFLASDYRKMVESCHTPKIVKLGARFLNKKIEQAITDHINR